MKIIDLRSDTVTKPCKEMYTAMMRAPVGDDVYGEDPTVNRLEAMMAEQAGMEAAIFAPSGTQTNLMAIMSHCERGDEYIVGQTAHTFKYEGGGAAVLGSVQPQPIEFETNGTLSLLKVEAAIKPIEDYHARTKLLCLENTTDGRVLPLEYLKEARLLCDKHGLIYHLDGARVFNAVVHLGCSLQDISQHFDSISICLSKGLGAPVGSVLCGSRELIKKARRWRKVLGGGMRQAGVIAAACIYALENNVQRLTEDHENAKRLAEGLAEINGITVKENSLNTNMVFVDIPQGLPELQAHLQSKGIVFPKSRLVTHKDISTQDIDFVIQEVKNASLFIGNRPCK